MLSINKISLMTGLLLSFSIFAEQPTSSYLDKPEDVNLPPPVVSEVNNDTPATAVNTQLNGVPPLSDLAKITGETMILKAELEKVRTAWQLAKAKKGDFSESSSNNTQQGVMNPLVQAMPVAPSAPVEKKKEKEVEEPIYLPVLLGVYGSNGRLQASLRMHGGVTVEASSGDSIPEGFMVKSISVSKVLVIKNGKTYSIGS